MRCVAIVVSLSLLAASRADAAPVRGEGRGGALVWPTPPRPTMTDCAKPEPRPRDGRRLLIAGGIIAGLGLIPVITGIYTRVKYGACGSSGGLCLDGTGQLAGGGVVMGIGAILLTVGGVRYSRHKQSRETARLTPHLARTPHGGAIAGLQIQF
jgi:hypothetical protein